MTTTVKFSTTPTARAWLEGVAAETGMALSEVVRDAVRRCSGAEPARPRSARTVRMSVRMADDLARTLEPGDGFTVSDLMAGMLARYRQVQP